MKRSILGVVLAVILKCGIASADTHYVSPYGADIYPYTSWINAADSIQKAIDAASYGDTVRVGAGTYKDLITMIPGLALIGAGMDSCIIDGRRSVPANYTMIQGADSSIVEGFHLDGCESFTSSWGIRTSDCMKIANNNITGFTQAISLYGGITEISNNIFADNGTHIGPYGGRALIIGNTFNNGSYVIWSVGCFGIKFVKNVITNTTADAIFADSPDSLFIENNIIISNGYFAIKLECYCDNFRIVPIRNNTLIGEANHAVVSISGFSNEIRNNIISGGFCGIAVSSRCVYLSGYPFYCWFSHPQVSYNALWGNENNYLVGGGCSIDTSIGGNIHLDPMFVGGGDYHLQYGSPCIDAGDPNIKDPDSSRSDIGCYGGNWGETYTYLDYPPKAPDSLGATSLNTVIVLSWKPNTESDLSHYLVYKDTIAGFIPDTFKIVGNIPKDSSVFRDYDFILGNTYYYQVSAWDTTVHESEYSDELAVMATSVGEFTEQENRPPMYQLFQNYPNPFNSSTVVWYYLPDVGYQPAEVEITVYNLLGKLVRTLVRERQYPGEHKVVWDGKDDAENEVASGIYFCKLKVSDLDLVKPRKMVLLR